MQRNGCRALFWLCHNNRANQELAGEAGAVEAVVRALDRFVASNQNLRNNGVIALRIMTVANAANAETAAT